MQETGISNVIEQSHEDSEFERKGSMDMLSIHMKSTNMFDSKRVNDSKLSVNQEFKKTGMLIAEEPRESSDDEDKITTMTGIVGPDREFLEDKPIKIKQKE